MLCHVMLCYSSGTPKHNTTINSFIVPLTSIKMAKFMLRPDYNSCFFPQTHRTPLQSHSHTPFIKTPFPRFHFNLTPRPRPRPRHRVVLVCCAQKNVKETQRVSKAKAKALTDLRVEDVSGKWPPWKNLPQRYKLIGTTSLAFVICNMDKVLTS